jgi:hypothetical protein
MGGAVLGMEACWPSGVVLRGRAPNRPVLRWLKTVVVSDRGKARLIASGGDREDVPESVRPGCPGWACAVEASLAKSRWHRKRGVWLFSRDEPGGRSDYWPGGARREGGVSLVCGSGTEREKAGVDTATGVAGLQGRERERANGGNRRH